MSEIYNVKLSPEIKEQWQALIEKVTQKYDLKKYGDAYPILMQLIEENLDESAPAMRPYIQAILTNIASIQSNILAMDSTYKAYQDNQEMLKEEAVKGFIDQINQLNKRLQISENKNLENIKIIKNLEAEKKEMADQIEDLKERLSQQKQIQDLLLSVKKMVQDKTQPVEETMIDGQITINDYEHNE